jgi:hypothetical protein
VAYTMKSRNTPKMQRAHFELIAKVIKDARDLEITRGGADALHGLMRSMADALASTNPAFRRADFIAACGMKE